MRRAVALALAASVAACTRSGVVPVARHEPPLPVESAPAPSPPDVRTTTIAVGGTPWGLAYGFEAVWTPVGDEIVEVDVRTDAVESRVRLDPSVTAGRTTRGDPNARDTAAIGVTGVWVTVPRDRLTVVHVDPKYQRVVAVIPIGRGPGMPVPIAVGPDAVWVPSAADDELVRIDPRTDGVVERVPLPRGIEPAGIALAGGRLWISDASTDALLRVEPSSGRVVDRVRVGGHGELATDAAVVWASGGSSLRHVSAVNATALAGVPSLCAAVSNVALGSGVVWAAGADEVCASDVDATAPTAPLEIDGVGPIAANDGSAWVAVPDDGSVVRLDV